MTIDAIIFMPSNDFENDYQYGLCEIRAVKGVRASRKISSKKFFLLGFSNHTFYSAKICIRMSVYLKILIIGVRASVCYRAFVIKTGKNPMIRACNTIKQASIPICSLFSVCMSLFFQ
jgi:hypothetical protein